MCSVGSHVALGSVLGGNHHHHDQHEGVAAAPDGYLPPGDNDQDYDYADNQLSQYQPSSRRQAGLSSRRQSSSGPSSRRQSSSQRQPFEGSSSRRQPFEGSSSRRQQPQFGSRINQRGSGQGRNNNQLAGYQNDQGSRQQGSQVSRQQGNRFSQRPLPFNDLQGSASDDYSSPSSNRGSFSSSDEYAEPVGDNSGQQFRNRNRQQANQDRYQNAGPTASASDQYGGPGTQIQENQNNFRNNGGFGSERNNDFGRDTYSGDNNLNQHPQSLSQRGRNTDRFFSQDQGAQRFSDQDFDTAFDPEESRLCPGGSVEQCISVCPGMIPPIRTQ